MTKSKSRRQVFIPSLVPESVTNELFARIDSLTPSVKADWLKKQVRTKFVDPSNNSSAISRREAAIAKWLATEKVNEETNLRLLTADDSDVVFGSVGWGQFSLFCRGFIARLLGEIPPEEVLVGSFSGGASTSRPRTRSYPSSKYLGKADVTTRCLGLFSDASSLMPGWLGAFDLVPTQVRGNIMFTVPKNSEIDRVACKEPDINMFLQKGVGRFLRERLRGRGIDLNDQSINRNLALKGSIDGSLATLDLSSASDSVTKQLVFEFLPIHWFTLLDAIRSEVTVIDGNEHQNEMFSSMGNGFTFELESLLFWVIAKAVYHFRGKGVSGRISIYGDDIIAPSEGVSDLIAALKFCGFSVNSAKSFSEGPFRESCGGHYSDGNDITPFFVREPIRNIVDVMHMANQLRAWGSLDGPPIIDLQVEEIWLWLRGFVPSYLWGGGTDSGKYQLVSLHNPRKRVKEVSKSKPNGEGGFVQWLNTTWDRTTEIVDGVETSFRTEPLEGAYELRRSRREADGLHDRLPWLPSHFLHEVCGSEIESRV